MAIKNIYQTKNGKLTELIADEGKVWFNKKTKEFYGNFLYLGKNDAEGNYKEVEVNHIEETKMI